MGNKNNVILNNADEQVGYYADLRASLVDSAKLYMDEDEDAMPKIYSDYERQKDFMAQVKEYMKES